MTDYVFHVLHNARPEYELDVLAILENGQEFTYEDVLNDGSTQGFNIGSQVKTERQLKDIFQPLRDLGLMERRQIKLTQLGQMLSRIVVEKPDLFSEIFHYLYYSTWRANQETQNCFSWSYRTVCDHLWEQSTVVLDKKSLASFVLSEANQYFQIESASFGPRSIDGITIWLETLSPPVIHYDNDVSQETFVRRAFCPPELLVLGIDFIYQTQEMEYGVNLLLSDEHRDAICRVCLLEPSGFDRVLEYAVRQFSYLDKGLGGGWGRYLTLHRIPKLEDFI